MAEKAVRARITLHCSEPHLQRELKDLLESEGHEVVIHDQPEKLPPGRARIQVDTVHEPRDNLRDGEFDYDFDAESEFSKE